MTESPSQEVWATLQHGNPSQELDFQINVIQLPNCPAQLTTPTLTARTPNDRIAWEPGQGLSKPKTTFCESSCRCDETLELRLVWPTISVEI